MSLTPSQRSLRASIAANARLSRQDAADVSAPARRAFLDKFEKQVDPDGVLDPAERRRRADHALRQHMSTLALKSAKARSKRSAA